VAQESVLSTVARSNAYATAAVHQWRLYFNYGLGDESLWRHGRWHRVEGHFRL